MAFINTPKSFSKEALPSSKLATEMQPFIDYVNQNVDQIQRALINQLTFSENIKGEVVTLQMKHNQAIAVTPKASVASAFVIGSSDEVASIRFFQTNTGALSISVRFASAIPIQARFQTNTTGQLVGIYQCRDIGGVQVGDKVSFSGFGAKANNGVALVSAIDATEGAPIIVCPKYPAVVAENMPSFVGTAEESKSVSIALLYS